MENGLMLTRRKIDTPGYRAWTWRWRRIELRVTRYALGENDRFGLQLLLVLKGQP